LYFNQSDLNLQDSIQDIITVHASLMAFMAEYKDSEQVKSEVQEVKTFKKQKKNKKKASSNRIVKITKKSIFKINLEGVENKEKKQIERHTESWKVRGHWRNFKSGKRVWINEYVKGNKEVNKVSKTYKL